jgi:hypothetical protein
MNHEAFECDTISGFTEASNARAFETAAASGERDVD